MKQLKRLLYYVLTLLFGLLGALGVFRSIERWASGEGVMLVQVFFGGGGLLLARTFLLKARKVNNLGTEKARTSRSAAS